MCVCVCRINKRIFYLCYFYMNQNSFVCTEVNGFEYFYLTELVLSALIFKYCDVGLIILFDIDR